MSTENNSPSLDISRYLEKLGLDESIPSTIGGLALIQTAHLQKVPYSTIDHFSGMSEQLDPARTAANIIETGRGGYCFELNNALFVLLRGLGFNARRHLGYIWREPLSGQPVATFVANHLALTVHDLPSENNPNGVWMTDVGLGDGPYKPLPLRSGRYDEGAFVYKLKRPKGNSWRLLHHPWGSFLGMDFDSSTDVADNVLSEAHRELVGSPTSRFVRNLIVELRPDSDTVLTLINCELQRRHSSELAAEELTNKLAWFTTLEEQFGLSLNEFSRSEKQKLWDRVLIAHKARKQMATVSW